MIRPPPKLEAPSQADGQEHSRATELGSQTTTRRELLRVLTRDTARYCGIPEGWIECHVLVVSTRKGDTHLHARLVLRYWDDTLVRHVMAFEMRLRAEILRFEPQASDWLHSVTWEFKAENCPHLEMPPRDTWGKAAAPASVMLLDSEGGPGSDDEDGQAVDDVQEDLAKLFAVRDSALAELKLDDEPPRDFAPTQPGRR
jgi:hypothetical protein